MESLRDAVALQDFHVHTFLSPCAKDPEWIPEAIARKAEALGIRRVVLADHYHERRPGFDPPRFYAGVDESCLARTREAVQAVETDVEILVACEIDMIRPGLFTVSEAFAHRLPVGLVAASHYHLAGIEQPASREPAAIGRYVLERMRAAIKWPPTQILAHPLCALHDALGDFEAVLDTIRDEDFLEVLSLAAERHVAMEIRSAHFTQAKDCPAHQQRFYTLARRAGCRIAAVSDAHSEASFGRTYDAVPWVEALGFRAGDVIDGDWLRAHRRG